MLRRYCARETYRSRDVRLKIRNRSTTHCYLNITRRRWRRWRRRDDIPPRVSAERLNMKSSLSVEWRRRQMRDCSGTTAVEQVSTGISRSAAAANHCRCASSRDSWRNNCLRLIGVDLFKADHFFFPIVNSIV